VHLTFLLPATRLRSRSNRISHRDFHDRMKARAGFRGANGRLIQMFSNRTQSNNWSATSVDWEPPFDLRKRTMLTTKQKSCLTQTKTGH
jgi:hypothetical protein